MGEEEMVNEDVTNLRMEVVLSSIRSRISDAAFSGQAVLGILISEDVYKILEIALFPSGGLSLYGYTVSASRHLEGEEVEVLTSW